MKKTILVIRESDEFSRILAASSYEIENLPLIEAKPLEDLRDFEKRLNEIEIYDGIFLTSRNAARIFADKLREKNTSFGGKVYILGKRSFELLRNSILDLVFVEMANTAREMLKSIAAEDLKNKNFLFIRGEKSLRVVPEFLAKTATVEETIVYETREISIGIDKINCLRERFEKGEIKAACFFSPSAAESFTEQFGAKVLHQTFIATIGKTTAEYFERRKLAVDFVSSKSNAENFAVELIECLRKDLPTKYTKETK